MKRLLFAKYYFHVLVIFLAMFSMIPLTTPIAAQPALTIPQFNEKSPAELDAARKAQERLLQDQQRKLLDIERLSGPNTFTEPEFLDSSQCFPIEKINYQGAVAIADDILKTIDGEFLNRCVNINDINEIIRQLTNWYISEGFITSRAYIPPQNLSTGTLEIIVIEGRLRAVVIDDENPVSQRRVDLAFPVNPGEILNIRQLEQGIDQLNRTPSNQASLNLLPGENPGESIAQISYQQGRVWRVSADANNASGETQASTRIEWDNPFGVNDQLALNFSADAGSSDNDIGSELLSYSLGIGNWTFDTSYSLSDYFSDTDSNGILLQTSGDTKNIRLSASRLIHRDTLGKTSLSVAINRNESRNFFEDVLLTVNSQTLSVATLSINHGQKLWGGLANIDLGYHWGLSSFGAKKDRDLRDDDPKAQFSKITLTMSYFRPLSWFEKINLNYFTLLSGQNSSDVLFGPQRITLGGQSSVRGFKDQTFSGDSGAYWRNELQWTMGNKIPWLRGIADQIIVSAGVDAGVIKGTNFNEDRKGRLSGTFFSLATASEYVNTSLTWGFSGSKPDLFRESESPMYFTLALRY